MKTQRVLSFSTIITVLYIFASVALIQLAYDHSQARAQQVACPDTGWMIGYGATPDSVTGIAHGPIEAWESGWTFEHEGHYDRVVLERTSDRVWTLHVWTSESGHWVQVEKTLLFKIDSCVYGTMVQPGMYLFFGYVPDFVYHDHENVEMLNDERGQGEQTKTSIGD